MIDFGLDPQESINLPHYMSRNFRSDLETPIPGEIVDFDVNALPDALVDREHVVRILTQTSSLSIIQVVKKPGNGKPRTVLVGGADQRRDGTVGGQ